MMRRMNNRDRDNLARQARDEFWERKAANPTYEEWLQRAADLEQRYIQTQRLEWLQRHTQAQRACHVREFIASAEAV